MALFGRKKGSGPEVSFELGDLTKSGLDAIVNAANSSLAEGAGVCGAVFKAAGSAELAKECRPLAPCPTGSAVITGSCRLSSRGTKYIIHAVGPMWSDNGARQCEEQLAGCYRRSLELADEKGVESIAFPSISTGIFGFPPERAASTVASVLKDYRGNLKRIVIIDIDQSKLGLYRKAYEAL
jgi:hypothetical protein